MTDPVKLTPIRRQALLVLAKADADGSTGRISNRTDMTSRCVYWKVADWLVDEGLATAPMSAYPDVRITARGREVAAGD